MNITKGHLIRTIVIAAILLVVVGGVAGGAWFLMKSEPSEEGQSTTTVDENSVGEAVQRAYQEAVDVTAKEGAQAGQATLDKELEKTEDATTRAALYSAKSQLASSDQAQNNYTEAVGYAIQASELDKTRETAAMVGFYYEQLGNTAAAIEYYEIARERIGDVSQADTMTQGAYEYYTSIIERLRSEG